MDAAAVFLSGGAGFCDHLRGFPHAGHDAGAVDRPDDEKHDGADGAEFRELLHPRTDAELCVFPAESGNAVPAVRRDGVRGRGGAVPASFFPEAGDDERRTAGNPGTGFCPEGSGLRGLLPAADGGLPGDPSADGAGEQAGSTF